ncbi:MAG: hypothetical protein IVW55_13335 [Chloroflexi bacterium]|nr:hypothetical protein [Chloroflexota bacterium]
MSETPRKKASGRKVSYGAAKQRHDSYDYEENSDDDYLPLQKRKPQSKSGAYRGKGGSAREGAPQSRGPLPKRDLSPYILGALVGALLVVLTALIYLLGINNTTPVAGTQSLPSDQPGSQQLQSPVAGDPPRMSLVDFKALYDDPAKRPLIIDVRAKSAYDLGHIKGAISFPEADVDARANELPKDKLIVAYCQ